ncbi:hypothetical protein HDV00_003078 [Rhizophlyctis rosea]|nr:hypothetical protein HDV00_003078 [Rhizophlyctis rosea]
MTLPELSSASPYLTIHNHPVKGRSYVTSRPVRAGTTLLRSEAYAAVPDCENRRQICAGCLSLLSIKGHNETVTTNVWACSNPNGRCSEVAYCSAECQDIDWKLFHQAECQFMKHFLRPDGELIKTTGAAPSIARQNLGSFDEYTLDWMWLLMRVLIRRAHEMKGIGREGIDVGSDVDAEYVQKEPGSIRSSSNASTTFKTLLQMCHNQSLFPPSKIAHFNAVAQHLNRFQQTLPGPPTPLSHEDLVSLICREECNSFGLYTFSLKGHTAPRQPYGLSLFPSAVFFNHACVPNVGHVARPMAGGGKEMVFYALKDMEEGEEACISYVGLERSSSAVDSDSIVHCHEPTTVPVDSPKIDRRTLKEWFFFDCDCERCFIDEQLANGHLYPSDPQVVDLDERWRDIVCERDGCFGYFVPGELTDSLMNEGAKGNSGDDVRWVCVACGRCRDHGI